MAENENIDDAFDGLIALIDSVVEQRDGWQAEAKNYAANAAKHEGGAREAETLLALTQKERDALKKQLAGAHTEGCQCHTRAPAIKTDTACMLCSSAGRTHPYVDPRCAERRAKGNNPGGES